MISYLYNVSDEDYDYPHLKSIEQILENEEERKDDEKDIKYEELKNDELRNDELRNDELKDDEPDKRSKYKLISRRIDNSRIRHKISKSLEVYTSTCKNVHMLNGIPSRGGAIIYTHYEGKTYFCLGVDATYNELTDFSGGKKIGETPIEGALRELKEESLGVFGNLTEEQVSNCLSFYTSNMLIIFIHLNIDMEQTRKSFSLKVRETNNDGRLEVSNIVWLTKDEFIKAVQNKGKKIYSRVRKILNKVIDVVEAL